MMRKIKFTNQNFYHIYNRGVEKRNIFLEQNDYIRFIHNLYEFNNIYPAPEYSRCHMMDKTLQRERLVDVICFSLMPNHFHLLLRQIRDNGITDFLRKIGTGYTMAFNLKNNRVGPLFQGTFKAIHIKNDIYLTHVSRYIHLNPLALKEPKCKEVGIKNWPAANKFLNAYKWSSYLDFIGRINFPSIINGKNFILNYFDKDIGKYRNFIKEWTEINVGGPTSHIKGGEIDE